MIDFEIKNSLDYFETRFNEDEWCQEYQYDGEWYSEDELVRILIQEDEASLASCKDLNRLQCLDLHFPLSFYSGIYERLQKSRSSNNI